MYLTTEMVIRVRQGYRSGRAVTKFTPVSDDLLPSRTPLRTPKALRAPAQTKTRLWVRAGRVWRSMTLRRCSGSEGGSRGLVHFSTLSSLSCVLKLYYVGN